MQLQTEAVALGEVFPEAVVLVVAAEVLEVLAEEVPVAVAPAEAGDLSSCYIITIQEYKVNMHPRSQSKRSKFLITFLKDETTLIFIYCLPVCLLYK